MGGFLILKKILHITGGSARAGFGHAMRSWELFKHIKEETSVEFISLIPERDLTNKTEFLDYCLPLEKFDVKKLPDNIDMVLTDLPLSYFDEYISLIFKHFRHKKIASLDVYKTHFGKPDIAINLKLTPESKRLFSSYPCKQYGGLDYAVIRKGFFPYRDYQPTSDKKHVLTSIGGADFKGYTDMIFEKLKSTGMGNNNVEYDIVLGPWNRSRIDSEENNLFRLYRAPKNIEELMARSSLTICNGGTTLLECCYLGIPAIVMPQTEEEKIFFQSFAKRGVGKIMDIDDPSFTTFVMNILKDDEYLSTQRRISKELVDGKGIERIKKIILND